MLFMLTNEGDRLDRNILHKRQLGSNMKCAALWLKNGAPCSADNSEQSGVNSIGALRPSTIWGQNFAAIARCKVRVGKFKLVSRRSSLSVDTSFPHIATAQSHFSI